MQWHVASSQLLPKPNLQIHSADTDRNMSSTGSVLSLSNSAWKLNAVLPIQVSINIALITALLRKTAFSDSLLSPAPVPTGTIPYLCLFLLVMTLRIIVALGLANNDKSTYDNETPRKSNIAEHLGEALFKLTSVCPQQCNRSSFSGDRSSHRSIQPCTWCYYFRQAQYV
jgi:hypothetical protein